MNFGQYKLSGSGSSNSSYQSLVMAIEQSGTNAPSISYVIYNDLVDISDIGFVYNTNGNYTVTSTSGVFTATKTYINPSQQYQNQPNTITYAYVNDRFSFYIETSINGVLANGVLGGFIEIRVYN